MHFRLRGWPDPLPECSRVDVSCENTRRRREGRLQPRGREGGRRLYGTSITNLEGCSLSEMIYIKHLAHNKCSINIGPFHAPLRSHGAANCLKSAWSHPVPSVSGFLSASLKFSCFSPDAPLKGQRIPQCDHGPLCLHLPLMRLDPPH